MLKFSAQKWFLEKIALGHSRPGGIEFSQFFLTLWEKIFCKNLKNGSDRKPFLHDSERPRAVINLSKTLFYLSQVLWYFHVKSHVKKKVTRDLWKRTSAKIAETVPLLRPWNIMYQPMMKYLQNFFEVMSLITSKNSEVIK